MLRNRLTGERDFAVDIVGCLQMCGCHSRGGTSGEAGTILVRLYVGLIFRVYEVYLRSFLLQS